MQSLEALNWAAADNTRVNESKESGIVNEEQKEAEVGQ